MRTSKLLKPTPIDRHTMPTSDVARVLGVTHQRVCQLDDELQPIRLASAQRTRRYDPAKVQQFVDRRAAISLPRAK